MRRTIKLVALAGWALLIGQAAQAQQAPRAPVKLLIVPGAAQRPATTMGGCANRPVRVVYSGYGEASPMPSCPQTFPDGNYSRPDGDRAAAIQ